jgi:putative salt-induced outer membrane protein YdiY
MNSNFFVRSLAHHNGNMLSSKGRMRVFRTLILALVLVTTLASNAAVVELLNGDRVSGKIIGRDDKSLHLASPILGELVLPLSSISKITEDDDKGASAIASRPSERPQSPTPNPQQTASVGPNVQGGPSQPLPAPQRISDRGKYHGKKYFIPVSIDFVRKITSMYNLTSSIKVGMNYFSGPTDSRSANVAVTIARVWLMHELKLNYSQDYSESVASTGTKTVSLDKMKTELRYRYNLNKRMYFQSDSQYGYSRVNNIDQDYLQSFGYGWRLIETKLWTFNVTPALSCQYQMISHENQEPSLAPMIYEEAEYRWTDSLKLRDELTAIFPVTGGNKPTIHFMISFKNKLIGNAYINFDYLFDYDGAVANNADTVQQTVRTSFGIDF